MSELIKKARLSTPGAFKNNYIKVMRCFKVFSSDDEEEEEEMMEEKSCSSQQEDNTGRLVVVDEFVEMCLGLKKNP